MFIFKIHVEITYSSMIQHEALLNLFFAKGIITKEEYLEEVKRVSLELQGRRAK
ncbi:hypothetical protein Dthio_PD3602 [Desulfonatronospira thiodismutans ASO3-1]|uniref:SHOCT domain-containing protein n=1 Tax=Desulfonatronospira thiodismutans ASO3-1 TaxID=555779 RepID=D6SJU5_9BACT|nr:hypothetical protein [Desulfonatronospira thiodismutans]EFI36148.1 hypothetical protein Dthio_PD3602 [Desulfonatronospira thiodismutans ASO3-1]